MFNFIPGDLEATRRYLAAQQPKGKEPLIFFLLKEQDLLTPEDRRFFTCAIQYVVAVVGIDNDRTYDFSFNMYSLPDNDELRGIDEVVRGVETSSAYEANVMPSIKPRSDNSLAISTYYGPKKPVSIDNAVAFQFHMESFCDYAARTLEAAVESRVEWRVPSKQFYFLAGQLPPFVSDGHKK